jgi:mannitol-specific phosphotransferase system IIBC component
MSRDELAWVGVGLVILIIVIPPPFDNAVAVVVGAGISFVVSWRFYQQASDDQKDIHARTASMLQTISSGDRITTAQDDQGKTVTTHYKTIADRVDVDDSASRQASTESDEDGDPKRGG